MQKLANTRIKYKSNIQILQNTKQPKSKYKTNTKRKPKQNAK